MTPKRVQKLHHITAADCNGAVGQRAAAVYDVI